MGPLLLRSRLGYGSDMRVAGCQVLAKAARDEGGLGWRLSALRREIEVARWTDEAEFASRYPKASRIGANRFALPVLDTVDLVISVCFTTGVVSFRDVVTRPSGTSS
jgi:hypothetical protein